jgi:protein ImuB
MKRVISLWLPRLSTDRIERKSQAAPKPLAAVEKVQGRLVVAAVNAGAGSEGVVPGQALADARALFPALAVAGHDADADLRLLARLADWCERYSPIVALDGDGLLLDVTGCAHLFGGEAAMLADLVARVAKLGFSVRGAMADSATAAWACARFARRGNLVVPPGESAAALRALPVASLRLSPAAASGLGRVGLRRIGDLYALPRAPLAARFGQEVWRRLDAALGVEDEAVTARHPPVPHCARMSFADPIVTADDIARAIHRLLHELCERLQREQSGARRLELSLYRVDGTSLRTAIGTARPARDPERLSALFARHLERIDPGFGIETLMLAASVVEPCAPDQTAIPEVTEDARGNDEDARAGLIDRLGNRFGAEHVLRLAARESHVPERAQRLVSAFDGGAGAFPKSLLRPPRLFAPPFPIEAVAPIPDDPPLLFRWRRVTHRVARAEGPERIACEWWREHAPERDYYRVEDTEGGRFWLYREGPYGEDPRWFLHGLFP